MNNNKTEMINNKTEMINQQKPQLNQSSYAIWFCFHITNGIESIDEQ